MKSIAMRFFRLLLIGLIYFGFLLNQIYGNSSYSKTFVVVLDAGHGGHDSGNRGNGYFEKTIALKIALSIGHILEKHDDITVIYTRKSDKFVNLWIEQESLIKQMQIYLFLSIAMRFLLQSFWRWNLCFGTACQSKKL